MALAWSLFNGSRLVSADTYIYGCAWRGFYTEKHQALQIEGASYCLFDDLNQMS